MRHLASSAASHSSRHGISYFGDYVQAHIDLGLAVNVGKATVIIAPLDAHKVRDKMAQRGPVERSMVLSKETLISHVG